MRLLACRLQNQLVARARPGAPAEVVRWLGAVQAQDYLASLWALGVRTAGATEASIERAIADGDVIRTHVFRGTWQYVAPEDLRWMLELVGPRVIAGARSRFLALGLDAKTLDRAADIVTQAMSGGKQLTRKEVGAVLLRHRIASSDGRLSHILGYLELRALICSGARRGKQPTFALLEERAPKARSMPRERALATLTTRYFQSRGPATAHDFAWWSGLPLREVREGIALAKGELREVTVHDTTYWVVGEPVSRRGSSVHLLPGFDEYLVAYKDRSACIDAAHGRRVNAGGGILNPALVIDGRVAGTWSRTLEKHSVSIDVKPFRALTAGERRAVGVAAHRYGKFLGLPERVELQG